MQVDRELLETVLDAALSTARTYRNKPGELYAIGQLEATANLIYVMICVHSEPALDKLEVRCQASALEAIERLQRLTAVNPKGYGNIPRLA